MSASIPKPGAASAAPKSAPKEDVAEEVAEPKAKAEKKIAVEAIENGWFNNNRIKPGAKFFINSEKQFSELWMKKI